MNPTNPTNPMSAEDDYARLVREDAATWTAGHDAGPDAGPLVARGSARLRRRRRQVVGGTAALVAAAVALPAVALGGSAQSPVGDPPPSQASTTATTTTGSVPFAGTDTGPDDAPPPDPVTMRGCGWFACAPGTTTPDTAPVLGEVMTVGRTRSGLDEVVWASDRGLTDPTSGENLDGAVLMTGFVRGEDRVDGVFALQPGHEFTPGCVGSFYVATTPDDGWAILGYVEGEADKVTYEGGTGEGATQSSTTVLPGYTVFVARGTGTAQDDYPTSFTAGEVTAPLAGCAVTG